MSKLKSVPATRPLPTSATDTVRGLSQVVRDLVSAVPWALYGKEEGLFATLQLPIWEELVSDVEAGQRFDDLYDHKTGLVSGSEVETLHRVKNHSVDDLGAEVVQLLRELHDNAKEEVGRGWFDGGEDSPAMTAQAMGDAETFRVLLLRALAIWQESL